MALIAAAGRFPEPIDVPRETEPVERGAQLASIDLEGKPLEANHIGCLSRQAFTAAKVWATWSSGLRLE
jgi:hypothetical protein